MQHMADFAEPEIPQESADSLKAEVPQDAEPCSTAEIGRPMLEVHAPHEVLHTWKGFFVHIATIVIGLFVAVAIEQSVEALQRRHEVTALRGDLQTESRQIIADARESEAAHLYELRWLKTRIAQTQDAVWKRNPIGPSEPNQMPRYSSPDIPIWRSAKAAGRTGLLTKGEVTAYAEVEYVQGHLDELESVKNTAERAIRSFNREFPLLPNGRPDLSNASPDDLHTYLGLLTTAYEAMGTYIHWLRIITGAESAVADGKADLAEIYASERKASDNDVLQTM
jgi:type II secretory pathway pseudopilin PulG